MSDLSRSLVDAAAEAIGAAVHMPGSRAQAQEAVAAVLETLAVNGAALEDHEGDWQAAVRRLAAEVKGEEGR